MEKEKIVQWLHIVRHSSSNIDKVADEIIKSYQTTPDLMEEVKKEAERLYKFDFSQSSLTPHNSEQRGKRDGFIQGANHYKELIENGKK